MRTQPSAWTYVILMNCSSHGVRSVTCVDFNYLLVSQWYLRLTDILVLMLFEFYFKNCNTNINVDFINDIKSTPRTSQRDWRCGQNIFINNSIYYKTWIFFSNLLTFHKILPARSTNEVHYVACNYIKRLWKNVVKNSVGPLTLHFRSMLLGI